MTAEGDLAMLCCCGFGAVPVRLGRRKTVGNTSDLSTKCLLHFTCMRRESETPLNHEPLRPGLFTRYRLQRQFRKCLETLLASLPRVFPLFCAHRTFFCT